MVAALLTARADCESQEMRHYERQPGHYRIQVRAIRRLAIIGTRSASPGFPVALRAWLRYLANDRG